MTLIVKTFGEAAYDLICLKNAINRSKVRDDFVSFAAKEDNILSSITQELYPYRDYARLTAAESAEDQYDLRHDKVSSYLQDFASYKLDSAQPEYDFFAADNPDNKPESSYRPDQLQENVVPGLNYVQKKRPVRPAKMSVALKEGIHQNLTVESNYIWDTLLAAQQKDQDNDLLGILIDFKDSFPRRQLRQGVKIEPFSKMQHTIDRLTPKRRKYAASTNAYMLSAMNIGQLFVERHLLNFYGSRNVHVLETAQKPS
jgi:hypothetical protein